MASGVGSRIVTTGILLEFNGCAWWYLYDVWAEHKLRHLKFTEYDLSAKQRDIIDTSYRKCIYGFLFKQRHCLDNIEQFLKQDHPTFGKIKRHQFVALDQQDRQDHQDHRVDRS